MSAFARRLQRTQPVVSQSQPSEWPDATNTGIAGVGLTAGNLTSSGGFTAANGATYQNLHVTGTITVPSGRNNVIIRRCLIECEFWGVDGYGSNGLLIEDCTFVGGGDAGIATGFNSTVRRCNISGAPDGMKAQGGAVIEDCYIHDLYTGGSDPHNDGMQFMSITGGSRGIEVRHCWIHSPDTSCIAMFSGQVGSSSAGITIENNYFTGPGYCIYVPGTYATNVQVLNNVFGTWGYGPVSDWWSGGSGNVWSGNTRASNGATVNP